MRRCEVRNRFVEAPRLVPVVSWLQLAKRDGNFHWTRYNNEARHYEVERAKVSKSKRAVDMKGYVAIKDLMPSWMSERSEVSEHAALAIDKYLASLPRLELATLDEKLRGSQYAVASWRLDWSKLKVENCDRFLSQSTSTCGLLSFHANGFVRALAVEELASRTDGAELPFLLIRTTDWVPQISTLARAAIAKRFTPEYVRCFVACLALIERLKFRRRGKDDHLFEKICDWLIDAANRSFLLSASDTEDVRNERQRLALAMVAYSDSPATAALVALASRDPLVRLRTLERAARLVPEDDMQRIVLEHLDDSAAPIRRAVLEIAVARNFPNADNLLLDAVFDMSASVRLFARFNLRERKRCEDFAALYRERLKSMGGGDRLKMISALGGLAETGAPSDAELVLPLLQNKRVSVQKEAIKTIAVLAGKQHLQLFVSLLASDHTGISRVASQVLEKYVDDLNVEKLWNLFDQSEHIYVKYNIVRLLNRLTLWERLAYLLKACASGPSEIFDMCEPLLVAWSKQYGTSSHGLRPSAAQAEMIISAIFLVRGKLPHQLAESLDRVVLHSCSHN